MNPYQPKCLSPQDSFVTKLAQHVKEVVGETLNEVSGMVNTNIFEKDDKSGDDNPYDQIRPNREKLRAYQA